MEDSRKEISNVRSTLPDLIKNGFQLDPVTKEYYYSTQGRVSVRNGEGIRPEEFTTEPIKYTIPAKEFYSIINNLLDQIANLNDRLENLEKQKGA